MKRFRFIVLFAISLLTTAVHSLASNDTDEDEDDSTVKPISSPVQLSSSMSDASTWKSSNQNTPSLNPSKSLEPNTYTASISYSSSNSISPTSSSSYNTFSTSSKYPGWIQYSSNGSAYSSSSSYQTGVNSVSSSYYPGWTQYSWNSSPSSNWGISPTSSYSYSTGYPYTNYYNNYAYPNTEFANTYIKPTSSYYPASYTYGINPSRAMEQMMSSYPTTGSHYKPETMDGPFKFPFPGGEGRFPHPGFPMGPVDYRRPPDMSFLGANGGFPIKHPVFAIDPANYQREPCEESLKNLDECCSMPKNIFKDEDLEKCKTSQSDIKSEICVKSCVLSNNNMYTPENKLNQMKVVEYFVSNSNFDETWKPLVKRAAYECISIINGKFTAGVSGPTNCNMIADYLDSCMKSYFVKPCPSNKIPATLVATTCSKKMEVAAHCDPFAMTETRKLANIAVPQHATGAYPGGFMKPIMSVDSNIAGIPPYFPPPFPMGQPQIMPAFDMAGPTRDCWKSLQMLPPICCNRPILIPEFEFRACENLHQASGTTDDIGDNSQWCQMECIFRNHNWLKDKAIDKEMASVLVANVTDAMWQPVVKDAFSKCFAKISEAPKVDFKKCSPDPHNLMTCVDVELVKNCAKKSTGEVAIMLDDKCKNRISQVENCDLFGTPYTSVAIPLAPDARPTDSDASTPYPNKRKDEKTIIHHRVGGGSGIMGSLANGVAAGVGAGVANGVVNRIFSKGESGGGQAQGAHQYAMPGQGAYGMQQGQGGYGIQQGQGAYGQGAYGMQQGQGAYGIQQGQGAYGQGAYGMQQGQGAYGMQGQGANGMQGQGAYGQGAYGQGAYGMQQGQGAYGMQGQGANGMQGQGAYGQQGPVKQAVPMQNSQPGKGNNPKKSDKFAEAAKKVVQNKKQTATNPKPVVPQKTSAVDPKKSQSVPKSSGSKKSSGGFFSKLSSKLGGGGSRRSGGKRGKK